MTALHVLKKVRSEMQPNAKTGEYELPVILKAMHEFAELRTHDVVGQSEQRVCDVCESTDDVQCYCAKCMDDRC